MQQNYEVIRFVQQKGKCHIVMDYVEGELLCNFLRKERPMEKEYLFQIIISIAKELDNLEKSSGDQFYPCLTPLHIVVKKDKNIAFLKYSERYEKQIEGKAEPFLIRDGTSNYVYSYGRTVQFILTKAECVPRLSWTEERKFKKIITKCLTYNSKKQYQNGQDIVNQLNPIKKRYIVYFIPLMLLAIGGLSGVIACQQRMEVTEIEAPTKSVEERLQEYVAEEVIYTEDEILALTKEYEKQIQGDFRIAEGEFLLQVYYKMDTAYAKEQAVKVGEKLFDSVVENREILADIYLEQKNLEKVINEYEILIKESPTVERYLFLANILEQSGRHGEAMSVCEEGSKYDKAGAELQLQYIRLLFMNSEYSKEEKNHKLDTFLSLYPYLKEDSRYLKLNQEINFQEDKNER